jgi:hypothetical protein
MSRVDLCGVAGGDAPSDDMNCGDVCCDGEMLLWWCCWSADVLGRPNFTNSALFKLSLVCCCLDISIHAFDDRAACLVLCWPTYLPLPWLGDWLLVDYL